MHVERGKGFERYLGSEGHRQEEVAMAGQLIRRGENTWCVRVYTGRDAHGKRSYINQTPEPRIRGLAMGVDVHDSKYARRVRDRCREAGLILSAEDTTLLLLPRLEVDHAVAQEGLEILEACL